MSSSNAGAGVRAPRFIASALAAYLVAFSCLVVFGCSNPGDAVQSLVPTADDRAVSAAPPSTADDIPRVPVQTAAGQPSAGSLIQRIDLGTVAQGERLRRAIIVVNRTTEPVTISSADASCECLTLEGLPASIGPGTEARLGILVDESRDLDFKGQLAIDVDGYSGSKKALKFQAWIKVIARHPPEMRQETAALKCGPSDL